MPHALVLGAGMVGSVIASDLAASDGFRVTIADRSASSLERARSRTGGRAKIVEADLSDVRATMKLASKADIIVGALPSTLGFRTLAAIAEKGMRYCDISFMPEEFLELDALAKKKGAVCVVDCGVAPGMSNLLAATGVERLTKTECIDIMVGGIPRLRHWPFEYKAGFSPGDVLEEYVRPSRVVENGEVVVKEALSEPELIDFERVGTLEVFNTDGLRSLVSTLKVPFMRERTMRYPGHIELMRVFRATGLFSLEPIDVGGVKVKPRDLLAKLLFPKWTYDEGEEDLTIMRVIVEGELDKTPMRLTWDLFDQSDAQTGYSSMSRTTAFPCTSIVRMMADGTIKTPGVHPPERLASLPFSKAGVLERVLKDLHARGVEFEANVEQQVPSRVAKRAAPRSKSPRTSNKRPRTK
ncbi:MAG: saccharopine dehydrogenase C-terminal domain-containing protein [Phycisphaerae bacterium]|nr:saccharopine dehydrogenase C-terminal domain-containing protein [Phycisphaerae bacterium]